MSHRTALANNKGGVGKTASTVNLAAALARQDRRVLVVDMDPQANTTRRLAARLAPDSPTVSEAIAAAARGCVADAIVPCGWDVADACRISIIPSAPDLANRGGELHLLGAVRRLAKALALVDDEDDATLFDCEPSLGHLTQLVMAAADDVLTVVEPEYDAVESAIRLRDFIEAAREDLGNPDLHVLGYLLSRVRDTLGAPQIPARRPAGDVRRRHGLGNRASRNAPRSRTPTSPPPPSSTPGRSAARWPPCTTRSPSGTSRP